MKTEDALDVSAYLTDIDIEHEIESNGILISRDSICSKISGKRGKINNSYDNLLSILGTHFNARFDFIGRYSYNDAWIMLDKIGDE